MAIYVTGDTHGDWLSRFSSRDFPEGKELTKNDVVIVCGDFGIWRNDKDQNYKLDWLNDKSFTTAFVCGNHENYSMLNGDLYQSEKWHGGEIKRIRDKIVYLKNGNIFDFDNRKFFVFGGARSHDIQDGIFDPANLTLNSVNAEQELIPMRHFKSQKEYKLFMKKYVLERKYFRVRNESWWENEMPTENERHYGKLMLEKTDNKVDYIVSHDCPSSILAIISMGMFAPDVLSDYFESISQTVEFKHWYFGHYHKDIRIFDKYSLLYHHIERII